MNAQEEIMGMAISRLEKEVLSQREKVIVLESDVKALKDRASTSAPVSRESLDAFQTSLNNLSDYYRTLSESSNLRLERLEGAFQLVAGWIANEEESNKLLSSQLENVQTLITQLLAFEGFNLVSRYLSKKPKQNTSARKQSKNVKKRAKKPGATKRLRRAR